MRAVVIADLAAGLDGLRFAPCAEASAPGPGEIRVKIHASSLNFHDYMVAKGLLPVQPGRILLSDASGIVTEVGARVAEFKPGDQVVSCFFPNWISGPPPIDDFSQTPGDGIDGFARSEITLPATAFTRAPKGWSHEEAATITTAGLTAWRALREAKPGQSVLALGTGGVSIYALQIAKALGATVVHTSSSAEKLDRLRGLGADHLVNYRETPEWSAEVLRLTGGRGADHVVEVGGAGTLPQSIGAVALGGEVHLIGVLTGLVGEIPALRLILRQAQVKGLVVGSRSLQQEFVEFLDRSGIRPVIDRSFPLDELKQAFEHQESGRHFGKIGVSIT